MGHVQTTRAQFRQDLKDKWESVPFWSDAEANTAIQEALRAWNMLTGQWHDRTTLPTTANTVWYSVPGVLVQPARMVFNGYPMEIGSLLDFDFGQENWEGQTTTDSTTPSRPTFWIPAGLNLFAIWPADAAGGNSLQIDGIEATPVLSSDADFVDIGREEYSAILGEALHIASFKSGVVFIKATESYHDKFLAAALEKNGRLKASTFFRRAMGLDANRYLRSDRRRNAQQRSTREGNRE